MEYTLKEDAAVHVKEREILENIKSLVRRRKGLAAAYSAIRKEMIEEEYEPTLTCLVASIKDGIDECASYIVHECMKLEV